MVKWPDDFIIKIQVIEDVFSENRMRKRLLKEKQKDFDRAPDGWLKRKVKPQRKTVERYLKRVGMEILDIYQPKEDFAKTVSNKANLLGQKKTKPEEIISIYNDLEKKKYNENPICKLFDNTLKYLPETEVKNFFNKLRGYYHSYAFWQKESKQTKNVLRFLIKIEKFYNEYNLIECLMASKKASSWNYKGYIISSRHKLLWLFECIDSEEDFYPEIITIYTPSASLSFEPNILKGIISGISWKDGKTIPCSSRILFNKINNEKALQMKIGYLNLDEVAKENQDIKLNYINNVIKNKQDILSG